MRAPVRVFERYYWGPGWQTIKRELIPNRLNIRHLSEEEEAPVDWLEGSPTLAARLKASSVGCVVLLGSRLGERHESFSRFPASHRELRSSEALAELVDLCQGVYGTQATVRALTSIHFYCTRKSLRTFSSPCLRPVTRDNACELTAWLVRQGQLYEDDPNYILDNGPAFAWYDGELPVGFASVHPSKTRDIGNIGNVFVAESRRGRGIAKAVVGAVAEGLLDAGRLPVYGCSVDNPASAGTAEGAGFKFAGCNYRMYVG